MARGRSQNRGGYRPPANPAAISPPGSGARTDGGIGDRSRGFPIAPGSQYGERAELESLRSGVDAGDAPAPTQPAAPGGTAGGPLPPIDPFAPSNRPNEPGYAGALMPDAPPIDADTVLRILYARRPTPWIASLLRD